mmetsp:Transcript_55567/g.162415  ORF Transcript_55567/g.162415 Transcript_55567/m.162415 type:complete len:231 (-) Transcript_55567:113-805(-)
MRQDGLPHATLCPALALARLIALGLLSPAEGLRAGTASESKALLGDPAKGNITETHPSLGNSSVAVAGSLRIGSGSGFLRDINGSVQEFSSCTQACDQCFNDHYQGCLAFCRVGCEDYCSEQLPRPSCERHQEWVAQVGHVFQALDAKAVMCQVTGPSGCPDPPLLAMPTPVPFEPYNAAKVEDKEKAPLQGTGVAVLGNQTPPEVNVTKQAKSHGKGPFAEQHRPTNEA